MSNAKVLEKLKHRLQSVGVTHLSTESNNVQSKQYSAIKATEPLKGQGFAHRTNYRLIHIDSLEGLQALIEILKGEATLQSDDLIFDRIEKTYLLKDEITC